MGSNIPLVALDPQQTPPMPRTPLEAYARATSLQGMIQDNQAVAQQTEQRAQAFPVQQQQQQEILKGQQQENQIRELQMQDMQILHQLGPDFVIRDDQGEPIGFDNAGFFNRAAAQGVSVPTLQALQAQHAKAVSELAGASKSVREEEEARMNRLYQLAAGVKSIKDPAARQKGWINILPAIAKERVDITQFPIQAPTDEEFDAMSATWGQHKQMLEDAEKEATIKRTARGSVEEQQLQSYLTSPTVPGERLPIAQRTPASFAVWKAKNSPTMMVQGNMLGSAGQGSALDQAAQRYLQTGELPSGFSRSPGTTAAIINRAAAIGGDQNIAGNKATFKADSAALSKLTTTAEQVGAFEHTAIRNLDLFLSKAKAIPDLGTRFANIPMRKITRQMIGEKNYAGYEAARQTAFTEVAKVLSSANANGVLSDSARQEVNHIIDGSLPLAAAIEVVETLKQDMSNRHQSYQEDIAAIRQRLQGTGSNTGTGSAPAGDGGYWSQFPTHKN